MNSNLPDENIIREYLLGTLPEKDWEEIEEKLLSDKEFADFADSIEDEIIDEYLAIQNHFLRPPERQRKLLFATVLNSRLKKNAKKPISIDPVRKQPKVAPRFYAAMATAAALLLISTSSLTIYTARLHNDVTTANAKNKQTESKLAEAKQELSNLTSEQSTRDQIIDLRATLRDVGQSYKYPVVPGTKSLKIHFPIDDPISPPYSVELRRGTEDKPLWSQDNVQPDSNRLDFTIPYFGTGLYSLHVYRRGNPPSTAPRRLQFDVEERPASTSKH